MKLLTYLERAAHFQSLSEAERDPTRKPRLKDQSMAYLKFAGRRARELRTLPPRFQSFRRD
jgi:hypothetical protein